MSSSLVADARDRARAASRAMTEAARAERRILATFSRHADIPRDLIDPLRDAIRYAAFAEAEAVSLAMIVVTLERVLAPAETKSREIDV